MTRPAKPGPQVYYRLSLPKEVSEHFEALAAKPGVTKSALLAEGVRLMIERRGASEMEMRFTSSLNHQSKEIARLNRHMRILLESFGLFILFMLTVTPPIAQEDDVSRAIGRDRFNAFIKRVAQLLARRRVTLDPDEQQ